MAKTPSGFHCPVCRYDMSGSGIWTCPECGHACTADDVACSGARELAIRSLKLQLAIGLGAALTLALVSVAASPTSRVGLILAGACLALHATSLLVGLAIARQARRADRAAWTATWVVALPWLHSPWVLAATVCGINAFFREVVARGAKGSFAEIAGISLFAVAVSPVFGGVSWIVKSMRTRARFKLSGMETRASFQVLAFIVWILAAALGGACTLELVRFDLFL